MKGKGYIAIHRKIEDSFLWNGEPFSKGQAWIDLLLLANHTDYKTQYRGQIVERKRGEVNRSISYLAKRWQWTRRKVTRFLKTLEQHDMIIISASHWDTVINIKNYDKYQKPTAGATRDSTHGTTEGTTYSTTHGTTEGTRNNNTPIMPNNAQYTRGRAREGKASGNELLEMLEKGEL